LIFLNLELYCATTRFKVSVIAAQLIEIGQSLALPIDCGFRTYRGFHRTEPEADGVSFERSLKRL
jgi:hypothetical protein